MAQVAGALLSRRLGFIQLGDRGKEARAVPLQLHRTYSANILQSAERSGAPYRQLRESAIGEYNIRGHMFLAGDRASDSPERA